MHINEYDNPVLWYCMCITIICALEKLSKFQRLFQFNKTKKWHRFSVSLEKCHMLLKLVSIETFISNVSQSIRQHSDFSVNRAVSKILLLASLLFNYYYIIKNIGCNLNHNTVLMTVVFALMTHRLTCAYCLYSGKAIKMPFRCLSIVAWYENPRGSKSWLSFDFSANLMEEMLTRQSYFVYCFWKNSLLLLRRSLNS